MPQNNFDAYMRMNTKSIVNFKSKNVKSKIVKLVGEKQHKILVTLGLQRFKYDPKSMNSNRKIYKVNFNK